MAVTESTFDAISYIDIDRMRDTFRALVSDQLGRERRVCDVGGGKRPLVPIDDVRRLGLRYTVMDISAEETALLDREVFEVVTGDAASPTLLEDAPSLRGRFDLAFSKMVAEHVPDGETFHRNLFDMMAPGGVAVHMFPTLYSMPFLVNWTVPEKVSGALLEAFASRELDKFPARYSWCKGPSRVQLERLRGIGWEVDRYIGVMGHEYYRNMPGVRELHHLGQRAALRRPQPWMTSYAVVQLRKPR